MNNNEGVKKIKRSGRIEKDAEEAQTLYGKEKDKVQRTEEVGRGPAEARTRVTSGIDRSRLFHHVYSHRTKSK